MYIVSLRHISVRFVRQRENSRIFIEESRLDACMHTRSKGANVCFALNVYYAYTRLRFCAVFATSRHRLYIRELVVRLLRKTEKEIERKEEDRLRTVHASMVSLIVMSRATLFHAWK